MQLFYAPDIHNTTATLTEEETHHCTRVLRIGKGSQLRITDGQGHIYTGKLAEIQQKKALLVDVELLHTEPPKPYSVHIALAPTKQIDRTEWFIEKSIEIGIQEITMLLCDNSERKHLKIERLKKVALSAMKQSGQIFLPRINPLMKFSDFLKTSSGETQRFIAYLDEETKPYLPKVLQKQSSYCILIGPEGDFSKKEIQEALNTGMKGVSLGNQRYRTETAGIAACFMCNLLNAL